MPLDKTKTITTEQLATLRDILVDRALICDRLYWDYNRGSICFRARWVPENGTTDTICFVSEEQRLAIMDDGTIVNRNIDRRFAGIRA